MSTPLKATIERNQADPLDFAKGFSQEALAQALFQTYDAPKPSTLAEHAGQFAGNVAGSLANPLTGAGIGAAIGGGLGLLGGPFAELTVPAGATAGAAVGTALGNFAGGAASQADQYRNNNQAPNYAAIGTAGLTNAALPFASKALTPATTKFIPGLLTHAATGAVGAGATDAAIQVAENKGFDPGRTLQSAAVGAGLGAGSHLVDKVPSVVVPAYKKANMQKYRPRPTREGAVMEKPMKPVSVNPDVLQGGVSYSEPAPTGLAGLSKMSTGKPSRFASETVQQSPNTAPEVAQNIQADYTPTTNKERLEKAAHNIATDLNGVMVRINDHKHLDDQSIVDGQLLASSLQNDGRFEEAIDVLSKLSLKLSKAGQAIQAATLWNKLTPEGAVYWANKIAKERGVTLTPEKAEAIAKKATKVQAAKTTNDANKEAAELVALINKVAGPSLGRKIATIQTMAQLGNAKTTVRNLLGNGIFGGAETLSDLTATLADKLISLKTGQRTKTLANTKVAGEGAKRGLLVGVGDVLEGVDTQGGGNKFELNKQATFEKGFLGAIEKGLGISLSASDRAFYEATYRESIANQLHAAKLSKKPVKITAEMRETAHNEALYRTFQDDNALSNAMTGLKKLMNGNKFYQNPKTFKEFGLGDLVLKYPKTPANIMMRGLDYSPVQLGHLVMQLAHAAQGKEFNQRDFVQRFGRLTTGMTGLAAGYYLAKLGIVTAEANSDREIDSLERQQGGGAYKINVSALKRFVSNGFNPAVTGDRKGDTKVTYDWAQPSSITLSTGVALAEAQGTEQERQTVDQVGDFITSLVSGADSLTDQPLLQGLKTVFNTRGADGDTSPLAGLAKVVGDAPAGFVPSLVNQTAQLQDNTLRDTSDANPLRESANKVIAKIPFANATLPARRDTLGNKMERYQDKSNNVFNVMLNPSFATRVKEHPEAKALLDIYNRTGETSQVPHLVGKSVQVIRDGHKQTLKLSAQERSQYQKVIGKMSKYFVKQVIANPSFKQAPDEAKVKYFSNLYKDINTAAKVYLFGHQPARPSKGAIAIYGFIAANAGSKAKKEAK